MHPKPSAPLLEELFKDEQVSYNCEIGCDVEFLVGKEQGEMMRIPVHSSKLQQYPVFRAMLSHQFSSKEGGHDWGNMRTFPVDDVEGKAFDNLMKFVYCKRITLNSCDMGIETLKAAHKYMLPELVRECVKHLYKLINLSNVLFIFAHTKFLCNDLDDLEDLTKPDHQIQFPRRCSKISQNQNEEEKEILTGVEMKNLCLWLLQQCLSFIDIHANHVLERDELENLEGESVKFLLQRDSLDCKESAVFSALIRWAETECKRQHLPLTLNSKRKVLIDQNLLYLARYLQMTLTDFLHGPAESGVLSPAEVEMIRNVLLYGQPFLSSKRRLSLGCCPTAKIVQLQLSYYLNESTNPKFKDVQELMSNFVYMSRKRNPVDEAGAISTSGLRRESFFKRKSTIGTKKPKKVSLVKLKSFGFIVKSFCLPLSNGSGKGTTNKVVKSMGCSASQENAKNQLKRKESKVSKIFDYALQGFAFFFD